MLLVKTKLGPSAIAGIGLFADEFIPKGTQVWKLQKGFDVILSEQAFKELSLPAQAQVRNYCYYNAETKSYVVCGDDARFFNHADEPNVSSGNYDEHIDCALRDINPGEELTQNYKDFDGMMDEKLH